MPADPLTLPPSTIAAIAEAVAARLSSPLAEMLTREDMARLLACGSSTFDRYRSLGSIGPQPVNLGGSGSLRWNRREVMAWLEHRDNRGELHDSQTWPPVWAQLQRKAGIGR